MRRSSYYFLFASVLVCFGSLLQNREQINEDIVVEGDEGIDVFGVCGVINKSISALKRAVVNRQAFLQSRGSTLPMKY